VESRWSARRDQEGGFPRKKAAKPEGESRTLTAKALRKRKNNFTPNTMVMNFKGWGSKASVGPWGKKTREELGNSTKGHWVVVSIVDGT